MEWIRYHPKSSAIIAGIATLLIIVFVWIQISPSDTKEPDSFGGPTLPTPSSTPLTALPSISTSPTATATGTGGANGGFPGFGGLTGGGGSATGGSLNLPGIQGGSMYQNMPRHSITLSVHAEVPIGTIGYVMPTSLRKSSGTVKNAGTSWSISSTVYGGPDYARIFVQAGARGFPITCVIRVDGKVTERRSTDGPYGQMVCQG